MTRTGKLKTRGGRLLVFLLTAVVLGSTACSLDRLLGSDQLPGDVTDPALTKTPDGALAVYHGLLLLFRGAFGSTDNAWPGSSFISNVGFLTDEVLTWNNTLDTRRTSDQNDPGTYGLLQRVRGQAGQAIGLLTDFAPGQQALAGHAYALEGYAEIFLAELYCSGIPLSTLDYDGDYTPKAGSTTDQVFTHAAALFDTALALTGDSVRFQHLAAVGKGRALLAREHYAEAAAAVGAVPDAYRYEVQYAALAGARNFAHLGPSSISATVANQEGSNGLDYVTSGDPRVPVTAHGTDALLGGTIYMPAQYAADGSSPVVLASGVEARLIEAEAALQANPDDGVWLAKLNALRTDGTQDGGGAYHPGTGGVAGLAPLTDPGIANGRVDLLFRERAFWLFLTGHRQGDLRRLIRQYGRTQNQLYPVGLRLGSTILYGDDITVGIPSQEQHVNPLFTGCLSRGA